MRKVIFWAKDDNAPAVKRTNVDVVIKYRLIYYYNDIIQETVKALNLFCSNMTNLVAHYIKLPQSKRHRSTKYLPKAMAVLRYTEKMI